MQEERPEIISTQVTEALYYYLDLAPNKDAEETIVVCGGRERCNPDYVINRNTFEFLGIEFVVEGEGRLILGNKKLSLQPGMAFSYGPGIPCLIYNDPERPLVKYFVDFVGKNAETALLESPVEIGSAVQLANILEISEIFDNLYREGNSNTPYSAQVCALYLELLLVKMSENVLPQGSYESRARETYQKCKSYIDENFLSVRSMDQIARECHIDPSYLCRLFNRFSRNTPYQYLMRRKMDHAANLLLKSGMLVKQVAQELNFDDPYHFSRLFKTYHKVSPTHFLSRVSRSESAYRSN